jgi:transcriptional regulator with XRE-family HTH domain
MPKHSPDAIDIAIGGRVRILRLAAHMSQTDLGRHLGVSFQQVQK